MATAPTASAWGQNHHDPETASQSTAPLSKPATASTTSSVHHLAQRALDVTASSWQQWMTPRYALPSKAVASQVLMYRQLLHTACRPGLKLSRDYQGTPAQRAVLHMPWWEQGIEESRKMIISYDNLMSRLWYHGAIKPFEATTTDIPSFAGGPPPIPHEHWVNRLGFQQPDPVTDFRSGGVLSLAMMVYMVESCPEVVRLFLSEGSPDRIALPFAITCINITDMLAKFLMLSKSVAQMDTLLSQRPFWRMFDDPQSILSLQEISMTFLCDVVDELKQERQAEAAVAQQQQPSSNNGAGSVRRLLWQTSATQVEQEQSRQQQLQPFDDGNSSETQKERPEIPETKVTVFDFSLIMERTERRVRDDLLGAGPKSVSELQSLAEKLRSKYQNQLERRIAPSAPPTSSSSFGFKASSTPLTDEGGVDGRVNITAATDAAENTDGSWKAPLRVGGVAAGAIWSTMKSTTVAATKVAKMMKTPSAPNTTSNASPPDLINGNVSPPDLISGDDYYTAATTSQSSRTAHAANPAVPSTSEASTAAELQDWEGTEIASATESIQHFSISDDEEDDIL